MEARTSPARLGGCDVPSLKKLASTPTSTSPSPPTENEGTLMSVCRTVSDAGPRSWRLWNVDGAGAGARRAHVDAEAPAVGHRAPRPWIQPFLRGQVQGSAVVARAAEIVEWCRREPVKTDMDVVEPCRNAAVASARGRSVVGLDRDLRTRSALRLGRHLAPAGRGGKERGWIDRPGDRLFERAAGNGPVEDTGGLVEAHGDRVRRVVRAWSAGGDLAQSREGGRVRERDAFCRL